MPGSKSNKVGSQATVATREVATSRKQVRQSQGKTSTGQTVKDAVAPQGLLAKLAQLPKEQQESFRVGRSLLHETDADGDGDVDCDKGFQRVCDRDGDEDDSLSYCQKGLYKVYLTCKAEGPDIAPDGKPFKDRYAVCSDEDTGKPFINVDPKTGEYLTLDSCGEDQFWQLVTQNELYLINRTNGTEVAPTPEYQGTPLDGKNNAMLTGLTAIAGLAATYFVGKAAYNAGKSLYNWCSQKDSIQLGDMISTFRATASSNPYGTVN
jgi:hypothetical protein